MQVYAKFNNKSATANLIINLNDNKSCSRFSALVAVRTIEKFSKFKIPTREGYINPCCFFLFSCNYFAVKGRVSPIKLDCNYIVISINNVLRRACKQHKTNRSGLGPMRKII